MRRILPIILCVWSLTAWCSTPPSSSPVTVDISFLLDKSSGNFETLVIPIKRVSNLIVIEARIDTLVGNFIFDTGTPVLVLNKTYFREAWNLQGAMAANAAGNSYVPVQHTMIENLDIRELHFDNVAADVSELGHIENSRGIRILGLLGVGLFTSFEVVIDLYKNVLYLHKLDAHGNVPERERVVHTPEILKVPIELMRNIITVETIVAGKRLTFCVDTGAETNALSNLIGPAVLRKFQLTRRMVMMGTGGSQSEVLFGSLEELQVGAKQFRNMPAAIMPLSDLSDAYGRKIDGIFGYSFLVKGIVSINFVKRELRMHAFDVSKP